jgi:deoxyribonuclease-4
MYGVHINKNYLNKTNIDSFDKILMNKSSIIQIFVSNLDNVHKIKSYNGSYVVHASYTINLAKDWDEYSVMINQLIKEIELAYKLNAIGIVIHIGKQLDMSTEKCYNNMYTSLLYVNEQTKIYDSVKIFIETSSGQGSEMCVKIEDYAYFLKKFIRNKNKQISDRFRMCIDTCHIYVAGYDITKKNTILMYLEILEELIGIRYVGLIHLNDAKNEIGSNVDRHENIDKGYIGKDGLLFFAKYFKKLDVPIILETPYQYIYDDLTMIAKL